MWAYILGACLYETKEIGSTFSRHGKWPYNDVPMDNYSENL